ncbi:D-alanyl-D-alanine carboxypeptidase/D-alanyl-D-alanine endopeptidase [Streptomyces otsuchiensis]|uniref:D-alanyl-D-alanine carboxypeptidase/D-alanyl-D-alanine endopeptidase n=2 Tax=Streptomyces TaxID=1883 RepID=UPI001D131CBA|nr:D-alanyl-D-alanine carboxypeptidase/D-alanyl-D-alanine-endopeptidase [Streptomyces otsuchiensis]
MHIPARGTTALRRHRDTWRLTAVAAVAGLMAAAGTVALAGPWDSGQRTGERGAAAADLLPGTEELPGDLEPGDGLAGAEAPPGGEAAPGGGPGRAPSADAVLTPIHEAAHAGARDPSSLAGVLRPLLTDAGLGKRPGAVVVDVATGEELYGQRADAALPPASTVKLVTATAALHAFGADHRLVTRVVLDADRGRVVLVGGGDTTLTAADLTELAARTARALDRRSVREVSVGYDTGTFSGPEGRHPIGVNDNIAPLSSLVLNAGRLDDSTRGPAPRAEDPAADAAAHFARELAAAGVAVDGDPERAAAPNGAERLANHLSEPLSDLVERILTDSDNDLAESLARHVAVDAGEEPTLEGAAAALTAQLTELGIDVEGVRLADGSGLDRAGRLTPRTLTGVLAAAADPDRPELRPVLTGLPIAGFTGTLTSRYPEGGGGLVRAKTGTLTGVNALAGTVVHQDGRVLAFAFLAGDTAAPADAEAALDRAAAALTGAGPFTPEP